MWPEREKRIGVRYVDGIDREVCKTNHETIARYGSDKKPRWVCLTCSQTVIICEEGKKCLRKDRKPARVLKSTIRINKRSPDNEKTWFGETCKRCYEYLQESKPILRPDPKDIDDEFDAESQDDSDDSMVVSDSFEEYEEQPEEDLHTRTRLRKRRKRPSFKSRMTTESDSDSDSDSDLEVKENNPEDMPTIKKNRGVLHSDDELSDDDAPPCKRRRINDIEILDILENAAWC